MKFCRLVFGWALGLVVGLFCLTSLYSQVDPTDDFSFSFHSRSGGSGKPNYNHYSLISEHRVSEILSDRLDLFPQSLVPSLASHLVELCRIHRLDPAYVLSLIEIESSFRVKAVSPVGALGLMQIMLPTGSHVLKKLKIHSTGFESFKVERLKKISLTSKILQDPFVNITVGITYLAWLRDRYKGLTPYHVLAAYNVGPARFDELITRKNFHPVETKRYFLAIRRNASDLRFYRRTSIPSRL